MPYVGRSTDKLSNVEVLDNITFDGSSSYTLQKNSVNFTPSSANTILLSIDGVVQAGNFTVSGSTIDFGTAVAGTSTCDFILHYGVGLITTPSDGTVTTAKLGDSAVTTAKLNDASVSLAKLTATGTKDATTFLRGDNTFAEPGGGSWILLNTQTVTGTPSSVESGAVFSSTYDTYVIVIRRINFTSTGGFYMYLGTSGGYTTSGYRWTGSGAESGTAAALITGSSSGTEISLLGGTGSSYHVNSSQDCLSGVIWVHNPYNSNRTSIHGELSWENASDVDAQINNFAAHPNTDTSYDRWKLAPSTGNFEATTIIQTFGVINA